MANKFIFLLICGLAFLACSDENTDSTAASTKFDAADTPSDAVDSSFDATDMSSDDTSVTETNQETWVYPEEITDSAATTTEFDTTDIFVTATDPDSVLKKIGYSKGKLIFRDDETSNLVMLDFTTGKFYYLTSGINAYHPEISPDGKYVAFSSDFENHAEDGGSSKLFVLNLETTQLIQLETEGQAAVPRWIVPKAGDTLITYVDNTGLTQYPQWESHGTWKVPFKDGQFGTPEKIMNGAFYSVSKDFQYAATAGAYFITRKKVNDSWGKDTIWYNSDQVCNVSMAKDESKRVSFLDLGGDEGVAFVGKKYYGHQRILVVDSLGAIIQAVPSPDNYAFDHTEWTSQGEFEIATLQDIDGFHTKIVLVNMETEEVTDLVLGGEFFHPCLWLEK